MLGLTTLRVIMLIGGRYVVFVVSLFVFSTQVVFNLAGQERLNY